VGLVAREVERAGIPTVTMSVVENMTRALPAPRNVLVRFRLGQIFGEPGHVAQQQAVLRAALGACDTIRQSGEVVVLPYRWKRERYPGPVGYVESAT
jgi:D-proline reductase (dithiol) PrdB